MTSIFLIFALIVATERATEILVSAKITEWIRNKVKSIAYQVDKPPDDSYIQYFKIMLDYLITCGYCVSVWIGGFFALFCEKYFDNVYVNWFVMTLFLHGMSNIYHVIYELIRRGRVSTHDVLLKVSVVLNDEHSESE